MNKPAFVFCSDAALVAAKKEHRRRELRRALQQAKARRKRLYSVNRRTGEVVLG